MKKNEQLYLEEEEICGVLLRLKKRKKGMVGLVWRFKTGGAKKGEFDELKENPKPEKHKGEGKKKKERRLWRLCVDVQGNVPTFASVWLKK